MESITRRKIAVVVPKYGLVGGGERFASEITERLARDDRFEIHVYANRWIVGSDRITFHKVPIIRFPRFLGPLSFAWFVKWKIGRMRFDLVHSHHWIFGADIFSAHGVPHAGWVRDVRKRSPSLYDRAVIAIERKLMKNGDASFFLPVSTIAMEAFRQEYATLRGQWQVVHPGVDVARFSTPGRAACRAEIRGRYGIGASDLLLLFVGMNFEVKGLDSILAALAKARIARPEANIRLLVVGRGDEGRYRKIARSLGIADAVTFAGTQVAGLERYYRAADVFIMLSKFDTFGMVVLEAMAAGLPAIVSPNVGAKDLVDEGVSGFVLPSPDDEDAAADRIIQLLDADRREAMGQSAARTASMHDWERLADKIATIYDVVIRKRPLHFNSQQERTQRMKNTQSMAEMIATEPECQCYLCRSTGIPLYEGLTDQWFGAPGQWTLKRCPDPECGLVWLDPMPTKEDVWKAYASYFTHQDYSPDSPRQYINFADRLAASFCRLSYKVLMRVTTWRAKEKIWRLKNDSMFLNDGTPGHRRLLDVGCGKGDFIARMRGKGWEVEGLEVDADAVEHARTKSGLTVHLGSLENIRFPDDTFDVITSNHVIEHVHDPISLIRECLRVLKPGGKLVLATPNMESFGHEYFGKYWTHLDPPRHLRLFTMKNLRECAERAGFRSVEVWSPPGYAEGAFSASIERKNRTRGTVRSETSKCAEASSLKIRAYYRYFVRKQEEVGEEIFLMATKATQ